MGDMGFTLGLGLVGIRLMMCKLLEGQAMRVSVLALFLAGSASMAQAAVPGEAELLACAVKTDSVARLACYDKAVAGISADARRLSEKREADAAALAATEAAAAARLAADAAAKAEADKLAAFGSDSMRSTDRPAAADKTLAQVDARLVETFQASGGNLVFALDNGQMWRQIDGLSLPPVRAGYEVVVKKGVIGGYRLTVDRIGRTVGVVRIR